MGEEYDGAAEFELDNLACFEEAVLDPYYVEVISGDEERFIDKSSTRTTGAVLIALNTPVVKDGKIVVELGEYGEVWRRYAEKTWD